MNEISTFEKRVTALIVILPLFQNYGMSFFSFIEIIMMYYLLLSLGRTKDIVNIEKTRSLKLYTVMMIIMSLLSLVTDSEPSVTMATTLVRFVFYAVFICIVGVNYFDMEYGVKVYTFMGVINSAYLLIQNGVYWAMHKRLQWNIPFLPVKMGESSADGVELIGKYRPSAFFSEPAHFAHYFTPLLILILFYDAKWLRPYKWPLAALFAFCMLVSGSSTGIVMVAIVFGIYIISTVNRKRFTFVQKIVLIFLAVFVAIPYILNSDLRSGFDRIRSESNLSTFNVRVYRGFTVFDRLPTENKLIGIGYGNYGNYVEKKGIRTKYDLKDSSYVNSAAFVLCGTGIIGFLFMLNMFWDWFIHTRGLYRYRVIILFISTFFSGAMFSMSFVLACSLILKGYNIKKIENNE